MCNRIKIKPEQVDRLDETLTPSTYAYANMLSNFIKFNSASELLTSATSPAQN